jgi:NarL family two-component system response regulator LiaR
VAGVIDEWALLRGGVELEMRRQGVSAEASAATMSEYMTMLQQRVGERPIDIAVIGQTSDATQPDAVRRLAATGATVIALAVRLAPADLLDLCAAGAFAVVGRDAQGEELSAAVRAARSGGRYIAPGLLSTIFDDKAAPAHQQRYGLTGRERQVLAEVVSGRSNAEISERLLIGSQTVKTHLSNIYDKLGVRRRTQAARLAVLHDLV